MPYARKGSYLTAAATAQQQNISQNGGGVAPTVVVRVVVARATPTYAASWYKQTLATYSSLVSSKITPG